MMLSNSFRGMTLRCPPEYLLRSAIRNQSLRTIKETRPCAGHRAYHAAVCNELGKPLTVELKERRPLKEGEVRIAVRHAAVNFGDILLVQGKYQEKPPLPFVPGSELSGEVLEVSKDVGHLQPGDPVVCISQSLGGFAEECIVDNRALVQLPDGIGSKKASSILVSYGTAYLALKHTAQIKEGDTVLVTAAAGAVGLATVELAAKIFKAKVIGACGGPEKCALVKEKGAFAAIDYNKENLKDRVKELTNGKGANIIVDAVGGDIFDQCVRCVAFEGRIVVLGFASGKIPKVATNILLVKSCSVAGVYWGSYSSRNPPAFLESIFECLNYAAEGRIDPHVSMEFDLKHVNEALKFVADRKSTGKVVVKIK